MLIFFTMKSNPYLCLYKFCGIICFALFLAACSSVEVPRNAETMGVVLPLNADAPDSKLANDVKSGMLLAAERINTEGGINGKRLEIILKDTGRDSYETGQAVRAMADSGIKFLHLGFTNQMLFEMQDLKDRDDLFINYLCTYPPATVSNKNSVRIFLNGAQVASLMATAYENPKKEEIRVVILNSADNSCKSSADYLSFQIKDDDTKVYRDVYSRGEKDFDIFAEQIIRLKAPYFFNYGHGTEVNKLLESLSKKGFKGTFVTNCPEENIKMKNESDIKAYVVRTNFEIGKVKSVQSDRFKKEYMSKYNSKPNWAAAYGYDSVILFAKAMAAANSDVKKSREFFLNKSFDAAIGKIEFDSMADSTSELSLEK